MEFVHIGWCKDATHDKVWGILLLESNVDGHNYFNKYASFWGRRGGKLQTKIFESSSWQAREMFDAKLKKGYSSVNKNRLDTVYPEFQRDLERTALWAILKA